MNKQSQAQYCVNADFSDSSFVNWEGSIGRCCPVSMQFLDTIVTGRHTIMTQTEPNDVNTCDSLQVVPPGYQYSVRLGNSQVGAQAERLAYSYTVTSETALFNYLFAAVLQDPGHSPVDQPRFIIRVLNQNGQPLNPQNNYEIIGSDSSIVPFNFCGNRRYNDWKNIGIDFTAYIDSTVTIEFSTGDCDLGGHYGYAYIVAECSQMEIKMQYCPEISDTATLVAPDGFSYNWSNGDTTRSISVANPTLGNSYSCTLTSVVGDQSTLSKIIETPVISNFGATHTWQSLDVAFTDSSIANNGPISTWHWDFGDGQTSNEQHPVHTYLTQGVYDVTLTVTTVNGCSSTYHSQVDFITVGVIEANIAGLEVFPVPSSDEITVAVGTTGEVKDMSVNIYDVVGNLVYSTSKSKIVVGQKFNINIAELSNGIYTLELRAKENKASRKFIKN